MIYQVVRREILEKRVMVSAHDEDEAIAVADEYFSQNELDYDDYKDSETEVEEGYLDTCRESIEEAEPIISMEDFPWMKEH